MNDKLMDRIDSFFKNISPEELEQVLIENGLNEIKHSSDGYEFEGDCSFLEERKSYEFSNLINDSKYTIQFFNDEVDTFESNIETEAA